MIDAIRAKLIAVNDEIGTGVGIEVYRPALHVPSIDYIASLYFDRTLKKADVFRYAIEQLRKDLGHESSFYIKTPHQRALSMYREFDGVKIRMDTRSSYTNTLALAEDAIKRAKYYPELTNNITEVF